MSVTPLYRKESEAKKYIIISYQSSNFALLLATLCLPNSLLGPDQHPCTATRVPKRQLLFPALSILTAGGFLGAWTIFHSQGCTQIIASVNSIVLSKSRTSIAFIQLTSVLRWWLHIPALPFPSSVAILIPPMIDSRYQ